MYVIPGDLPAEDVYKWTKMYNETGNLDIPDHFISKALSDSSKNGKVNIHSYLTKLGNVANNDKIFWVYSFALSKMFRYNDFLIQKIMNIENVHY